MKNYIDIYNNKNMKCGYTSYPIKINKKCIEIDEINKNNVESCSFVGVTLDILIGLIYFLNKYDTYVFNINIKFYK